MSLLTVLVPAQFSCTQLASGKAYLDADLSITCYDKRHRSYIGAAVVWLFIVPVGVPYFFIRLLRHFKVPQMVALLTDNAWLREAAKLAWQAGVAQPTMDVEALNVHSVSDAHLEALYALLVRDVSAEHASNILSGAAPPLTAEEDDSEEPGHHKDILGHAKAHAAAVTAQIKARAKAAHAAAVNACRPARPGAEPSPQALRRAFLLTAVLGWCKTSGVIALPALQWKDNEEEFEEEEEAARLSAATSSDAPPANKEPVADADDPYLGLRSRELPAVQVRAMKELGFLLGAYRIECWCVPGSSGSSVFGGSVF